VLRLNRVIRPTLPPRSVLNSNLLKFQEAKLIVVDLLLNLGIVVLPRKVIIPQVLRLNRVIRPTPNPPRSVLSPDVGIIVHAEQATDRSNCSLQLSLLSQVVQALLQGSNLGELGHQQRLPLTKELL
ncbi:unnamed protein product, partial [Heterosigma akashiwo]